MPGFKMDTQRRRATALVFSLLVSLMLISGLAYTADRSAAVLANVDLQISQTVEPEPVVAGALLTYTLTVVNNSAGPGTASQVIVSDTLPQESLFQWAPDYCIDGAEPRCLLGDMASGTQRSFTITVRVDPSARGQITNTATVSARERDNKPKDNVTEVASSLISRTDLEIGKLTETETTFVGTHLTYTLAVTNHGPSTANEVRLIDQLPPEVTFERAFPPICAGQATVSCPLGSLAPGEAATVTLIVLPTTDGRIRNRVSVTGMEIDPVPFNNLDIEVTDVLPAAADLVVEKRVQPADVLPGQLITYTVRVQNSGPSVAHQVAMTDTLPPQVQFGGIVEPATGCSGESTIICEWPQLDDQAIGQLVFTATVRGDLPPDTSFTNQASVRAAEPDPGLENNEAAASNTVRQPQQTDLALQMDVDAESILPGEVLTYRLIVTNNGPAVAHNVVLTDTLPNELVWGGLYPPSSNCTQASLLICVWPELAVAGVVTVEFSATVRADVPADTLIHNLATVAGQEPDFRDSNNSDSASSRVKSTRSCLPHCLVRLPLVLNDWPSWQQVGAKPARVSQFYALATCGERVLAGSDKGLYSLTSPQTSWQQDPGVSDVEVRAITFAGHDCSRAFAATVGQGVFAGTWDNTWSWTRIDPGLDNARSLVTRPDGSGGNVSLYVGGDFGIYWTPILPAYNWQATSIRDLTVGLSRHPDNGTIFAATWGHGIFRNSADGAAWHSEGVPANPYTYEVASDANGSPLAVGTTAGLYCLTGGEWKLAAGQFENKNTHALSWSKGTLFAGRKGVGVLLGSDGCQQWALLNNGLSVIDAQYEVRDLHVSADGWLYAATSNGIWRRPAP